MNLKLKDPTNQNSSFQFEKKKMKLVIKKKGGGINLKPQQKKSSGMLIHFLLALYVNYM